MVVEPQPNETCDPEKYQHRDQDAEPEVGAKIIGLAAQGMSHQGRLLRKAVVVIEGEEVPQSVEAKPKSKAKTEAAKKKE